MVCFHHGLFNLKAKTLNKFTWRLPLVLLLCCTALSAIKAQDIHYSQVGNSPMNMNPGLTGVYKGDYRFLGNYRYQWQTVPVDYLQFTGQFDTRISNKNGFQSPFALGLLYNYDRAGDSRIRMAHVALQGSYTRAMAKTHFVTLGTSVGLTQRAFSLSQLHFGDQYDGDSNTLPSAEVFDNNNLNYVDLSAGLNWHIKSTSFLSRSHANIGVGLFHINNPSKAFRDPLGADLYRRLSFYGRGIVQMSSNFDLQLHGSGQVQGPHREAVFGAGGIIHLNTVMTKETAIQLAVSHRLNEAWIPQAGILHKGWQFYLSYDINVSKFQLATIKNGGPEMTLIYIISKVGPMEHCPMCPTYL